MSGDSVSSKDQCSDDGSSTVSRCSDNVSEVNQLFSDSLSVHSCIAVADNAENKNGANHLSLASNLNRCLNALIKIREIYPVPFHLEKILKSLQDELAWCVTRCCGERTEHGEPYSDVSKKLHDLSGCYTKLRLIFNKSPYWEYYHRNVREISVVLECCRNHRGLIFERQFVSMDKIVGARTWGAMRPNDSSYGATKKFSHVTMVRDKRLTTV